MAVGRRSTGGSDTQFQTGVHQGLRRFSEFQVVILQDIKRIGAPHNPFLNHGFGVEVQVLLKPSAVSDENAHGFDCVIFIGNKHILKRAPLSKLYSCLPISQLRHDRHVFKFNQRVHNIADVNRGPVHGGRIVILGIKRIKSGAASAVDCILQICRERHVGLPDYQVFTDHIICGGISQRTLFKSRR